MAHLPVFPRLSDVGRQAISSVHQKGIRRHSRIDIGQEAIGERLRA